MTPWYVKAFWWIVGIWAALALMYSCDTGEFSGVPSEYDYYLETIAPDTLCRTGPC